MSSAIVFSLKRFKMKNKNFILIFFLCFIAINSTAQQDSTEQSVLVEEVTVKGKSAKNNGLDVKQDDQTQVLIDQLLYTINGVSLIKRGNYAQEPIIRGLSPQQINTTIDGMYVFGACTDHMDPISSYVEPNNLSSIKLNFGPSDEQIGASIGGGFNFNLMKAQLNANHFISGSLGTGYETNSNAYRVLGGIQFSKNRWAIQANGIYRKAQNYRESGGREIHFSQYEKYNFAVNGVVALNENNKLFVDYVQDNGTNIGYPALTMDVSYANAKIGSISHQYRRSGKRIYFWETKMYYNFIDHAMDDTKRPDSLVAMHMDMPGTSKTAGFYSNASIRLGKKHFAKVKLNGFANDLHAEMTMYPSNGAEMFMLTIPDTRRMLLGLDFSDKILLSMKMKLTAGARIDYVHSSITTEIGRQTLTSIYNGDLTKTTFLFNGFLQGSYDFSKKLNLSGGVAKAMRAPSAQEQYGFYLFNRLDNYDYMGNPDIKIEQSWNANVEMTYRNKKMAVSAKLFSYFFEDYITGRKLSGYSSMTSGATGVKQYTNIDHALIAGAELTFKWRILKQLFFSSSNAYSYGEDDNHIALFMIPPFKTTNTLTYVLKGYKIQLENITAMAQNHVDFNVYGEKRTPSFNVMNLSVGKTFTFKERYKYNIGLSLNNIFDTAYFEHLDVFKINRQGRNLLVNMKFTF